VPDNSILREFIGGSIMEKITFWRDRAADRPAARA